MLKENLIDGKSYIATDKEGNKYTGTFVDKYIPGGVFFCVFPAYCSDGNKNELVSFEEYTAVADKK